MYIVVVVKTKIVQLFYSRLQAFYYTGPCKYVPLCHSIYRKLSYIICSWEVLLG
jgi:hypothetical protein